jgi:formylglycine-generating enzyme required for sulfatase activity
VPRLFISHSSKDNIEALAFQRWLMADGWSEEDVFIDLHGISAGERWRERLRKANTACEAVILLASPDSLDSKECQCEMNLAEDLGKEIIVAILRDVKKDDPRPARYADRQFVDLSAEPTERMEPFERDGKVHRVEFHLPALQSIKARLADLGIAPESFSWKPKPGAGPYPGLAAFTEDDAGIFFGREAEIMAGVRKLRIMRRRRAPRLLVIQAASGSGKSSYLRAGLWPRLTRDLDFTPLAILRPALGILTGPDGVGRKLAPFFQRHGVTKVPGNISAELVKIGSQAFAGLIAEAASHATVARRAGVPDARPPAPLLAIDQGEEMFAADNAAESQRFLEMLAEFLREPPSDVDPYVLITIRADSVEKLLQRWPALGLEAPETQVLPPLSLTAYRDVIVKPAELYSQRVRRLSIEPELVGKLAQEATGADALPLLAFTLEKLFLEFGADGKLTAERYDSMGGIGGSIDRALAEAQCKAAGDGGENNLRRLIIPGLATWDPAASAAKRLVAKEAELTGGERKSLAPLASALVEARLLTRNRDTLEVAHEALLRRPPIDSWLERQKGALKLRDDVLKEAGEWASQGKAERDLVRRGDRLKMALALLANPDFAAALVPAKDYLGACERAEKTPRRRTRYMLLLGVIASLGGIIEEEWIGEQVHWIRTVRPYIAANFKPDLLSSQKEKALKPGDTFRECKEHCPEMVVIPAGTFVMGSPDGETPVIGLDGKPKSGPLAPKEEGRGNNEGPQHEVKIPRAFAAGKYTVTFDEWDECKALGGCPPLSDSGWGRGRKPVINVSWDEAQKYVMWLKLMTGKNYRLLSEAEWEYAARAGTATAYSFGENYPASKKICEYANFADISLKKAAPAFQTSDICDDGQVITATVGSYKSNSFGLHDMHGNVNQWTEDCWVELYENAPKDGSASKTENCDKRVARGGSWSGPPENLRSAYRAGGFQPVDRHTTLGFRVGRTLEP